MSAAKVKPQDYSRAVSVCTATEVERTAFYLNSRGDSLFAWLHRLSDQPLGHHGILICPPIGFEQLHAHRALRHLADSLARSNFPTVRFDWHGTGDSAGDDMQPGRCQTWLDNVRDSVRWMKNHLGCQQVSVVGLRIGATLAALALNEEDIENLVLWAPVTNGRAFVRELNVIDMLSEARPPETIAAGVIDAAGFRLSAETSADLSKRSLLQSKPHCRRILVAWRDDTPADLRVIDHFQNQGVSVDLKTLTGVPQMLVEPHKSQLPVAAIGEITNWFEQHAANEPVGVPDHEWIPTDDSAHLDSLATGFEADAFRETVWPICQSPNLFGILSQPKSEPDTELPIIVLLNAGAAYRIGPGRMNVELSRHFNHLGFRCLRMDLCGLGDSVPEHVSEENDSYAATAFRDIAMTLQALREKWSGRRFVLMGLCSGAYASFQSAAQFTDADLVECILINPLTFFWQDGMTLETAPTVELIREHYYFHSALQPGKWFKLLSGRSHIGIAGALRMAAQRLGLTRSERKRLVAGSCHGCQTGPAHPAQEDLTGDLKRIVASKRQLTMVFSQSDPGYSILTSQAGRQVRRMLRSGQMQVNLIEDADHTFSRHAARQKLMDTLARHLLERYRPSR
ncbi:MAG: alpha/beta fold hydrolase [Planctomycetes bacterium]|nr:alpha/beta fold hydrolase [Planctomycetota bacterium]